MEPLQPVTAAPPVSNGTDVHNQPLEPGLQAEYPRNSHQNADNVKVPNDPAWQTVVSLPENLRRLVTEYEGAISAIKRPNADVDHDTIIKKLEDALESAGRKARLSDLKLADMTREKMSLEQEVIRSRNEVDTIKRKIAEAMVGRNGLVRSLSLAHERQQQEKERADAAESALVAERERSTANLAHQKQLTERAELALDAEIKSLVKARANLDEQKQRFARMQAKVGKLTHALAEEEARSAAALAEETERADDACKSLAAEQKRADRAENALDKSIQEKEDAREALKIKTGELERMKSRVDNESKERKRAERFMAELAKEKDRTDHFITSLAYEKDRADAAEAKLAREKDRRPPTLARETYRADKAEAKLDDQKDQINGLTQALAQEKRRADVAEAALAGEEKRANEYSVAYTKAVARANAAESSLSKASPLDALVHRNQFYR